MKTVSLTVPDFFDLNEKETKLLIASKLYEQGKLSLGEGAELAGVSKRTFIELLGNYNVSVFNYSVQELKGDIDNA
jgi:predicted HTH domain antitoxin